ncbi:MAG TPA: hypothetical protein VFU05_07995 [Cyclobacteriaceae bacterium]|nr:hypothetical protein [Cyclobacteriaceae bacterium]
MMNTAIILILLIPISVEAQIYSCPLTNGRIKEFKNELYSRQDPDNGVVIYSIDKDSTVTSIAKGNVIKIVKHYENNYSVIVGIGGMIVAYKDLLKTSVVKGQSVDVHDIIGFAIRNENGLLEVRLSMWEDVNQINLRPLLECK